MNVKKRVGCSMFALGTARLAFSLIQHLTGHVATVLEIFEALPFLATGMILYATDVHKHLISASQTLYKTVELKGFDAFNYVIANLIISFSQKFRKTHTGVLPYNMLAVLIGMALILISPFLIAEYFP